MLSRMTLKTIRRIDQQRSFFFAYCRVLEAMFAEFLRRSVQICRNSPLMHMGLSKVVVPQMNIEDTPSLDRLYITEGLPKGSVGYHYLR